MLAHTQRSEDDRERAQTALASVLDPELGLSIVDLGLVGDVLRDEVGLTVELLTTTPACPLREVIEQDAREALERAFVGTRVEVRASEEEWTPERMNDTARRALGWE